MKKIVLVFLTVLLTVANLNAQKNLSVDIDDDIYNVLNVAEMRGLCAYLPGAKPYTVARILKAIDQIFEHEDKLNQHEVQILQNFRDRYVINPEKKNGLTHVAVENESEKFHCSFLYDFGMQGMFSGGFYNDSSMNSVGMDMLPIFDFRGDITKYLSYGIKCYFDASYMPLYDQGDYFIGYSWFDAGVEEFSDGAFDSNGNPYPEPHRRTIKKQLNNSYLPYTYRKPWDGQIYLLSDMSASGTEGWATELGISGGITAEIKTSLLDDRLTIGAGRQYHEWAAMDNGSSLVMNKNARPFFEFNTGMELFPWLKFSTLAGILEYPNADYMNEGCYPEDPGSSDDSYFFQNAFSLNMIELDFKYLHLDFGSSVVYPKRFELGYLFPLVIYVEYQNHIGDSDNLALFGDIKVRKPGLGSIWGSVYMDEINIQSNLFTQTRVMFAGQLGAKAVLPKIPFGSISFRYTKVEPYCYTHHAINYTSWYNHYIMENYTNNGECLGYYLPPNSDEFHVRFEARPRSFLTTSVQYQFIRHGADYGSQQVPGSSLYSEMNKFHRDELEKYFLHDGAYNWMHIISLGTTFEHKNLKRTLQLNANAGFLYSYYTMIDSEKYDRSIYGNYGNCKDVDFSTKYYFVDNEEYPVQFGAVLGFGIKVTF